MESPIIRLLVLMIGKALLLLLTFAMPIAQAHGDSLLEKSNRNALVGTWRLIRYADTPKGSEPVHVFGESPIGQFIFTEDGHMSVHIMHNPPNPKDAVVDPDPEACIPSWYCGYFGTYTVDAKEHYWVTRVLGGNIPAYIGTDQKRTFKIIGDQLVISETYISGHTTVAAERVLVRDSEVQK